jgi:hypothetical protein
LDMMLRHSINMLRFNILEFFRIIGTKFISFRTATTSRPEKKEF